MNTRRCTRSYAAIRAPSGPKTTRSSPSLRPQRDHHAATVVDFCTAVLTLERALNNDEFAIEHEVFFGDLLNPPADLGEVARQRLRVARPEENRCRNLMARQRKPSYFGSYCQPAPDGSWSTGSASTGGRSRGHISVGGSCL